MRLLDLLKDKLKIEKLLMLNLSKKTITNLIVVFCIGLVLILAADFYKDIGTNKVTNEGSMQENTASQSDNYKSTSSQYLRDLEDHLSNILSKIQGAGKVSVMITLKSGTEIIPAKDESISDRVTNEKDTEGGIRTINEKTTSDKVVFAEVQGGSSEPLILKEINPEIKGVIVVAGGAKDARVKLKISQAVQTVLDIPAYRVTVYERE